MALLQIKVRVDDRDYYGNKRLELAGQVNPISEYWYSYRRQSHEITLKLLIRS